jgi:hypothetical protein
MDLVADVGIFLIGGMAAIVILRLLLFHFWERSHKKIADDQYLKRIAEMLQ